MTLICFILTSITFWFRYSIIKTMFNCVSHAMYINFSTICCRFTMLTFIVLFDSFSVIYNSDFIDISIVEQFFNFFFDKISVMYEIWIISVFDDSEINNDLCLVEIQHLKCFIEYSFCTIDLSYDFVCD